MASKVLKGLTIEIGGDTTKLGKALEGVEKKGRDLSKELGEINKLLKFDPKNTQLLAQKQQVLGEAVGTTREKLDKLKEAEKQVQAQFEKGEASEEQVRALQREIVQTENKLKSYERAVAETAEEIEKLGKDADDAGDEINDLGDDLDKAKKDIDQTGNEAKKAGQEMDKAGDKGKGFGDKLKTAGGVAVKGLTAVVAVVSAAATGLAAATASAAAYADEIITLSTVTGVSSDKLQELKYASDLVEVSVETVTKSMAKNIKSMDSASKGSKAYADAYKTLGVSVKDANGHLRDSETVYWETIDALSKIENETERDAVAMQLFGKSAQDLNPLIDAGADKMQELAQEAHEVGAVMSTDALAVMGAFDDSVQRLKSSASAAKNSLGSVLLPELQLLTDAGNSLLNDFTKNLNASGGGLSGFISTVDSMAGDIGTMLSDLVTDLLDKAVKLAPSLVKVALTLVTTLVTSVITTLPQQIIPLVVGVFNNLAQSLPGLVQTLASALPGLVSLLISGVSSMIVTLCQQLVPILQPLLDALPDIVISIVDALVENLPLLIEGLINLCLGIVEALPEALLALVDAIPTVYEQLIGGLLENLPLLLDGIFQLLLGIVQAMPELVLKTNMVYMMVQMFKGAWEAIKKVFSPEGAAEWFGKIWTSVKNAFKSVTSWLRDTFSKAWTAVKNVFSTGGKIFDGIKDGIASVFKTVVNAIIRGINKVIAVPFNAINGLLNKIRSVSVAGVKPFSGFWKANPLTVPKIPELAKGGVLEKGQVGLLEGDGAEAVVPLERNLHWLQRVAEMLSGLLTEELDGLQLERSLHNRSAAAASAAAAVDGLTNKLDSILEAIERGKILVLDTNVVAGGTAGKVNNILGTNCILTERGAL